VHYSKIILGFRIAWKHASPEQRIHVCWMHRSHRTKWPRCVAVAARCILAAANTGHALITQLGLGFKVTMSLPLEQNSWRRTHGKQPTWRRTNSRTSYPETRCKQQPCWRTSKNSSLASPNSALATERQIVARCALRNLHRMLQSLNFYLAHFNTRQSATIHVEQSSSRTGVAASSFILFCDIAFEKRKSCQKESA
jgi:hypothetical protein